MCTDHGLFFCESFLQVALGVTIGGATSMFSFHIVSLSFVEGMLLPFTAKGLTLAAPEMSKGILTTAASMLFVDTEGCGVPCIARFCFEAMLPQRLSQPSLLRSLKRQSSCLFWSLYHACVSWLRVTMVFACLGL